ncbi:MAG TPA: MFS transporter [Gaiellales bacterium]|nr:MFS transporter [Gaiellales bacterium]
MTPDGTPAAVGGGYLDALGVGEFRALFAAYTVSMLGDIVAAVALTVLVYQRTASPFLAGVTFTLAFLPYLFGGALLSSLVDRVPPRRLMIACDLLSAAIVALMAASSVPVPVLLALLFTLGLISPVASGMRNALLTVVLPASAFIAGRSLFRIVAQSAQVVGNAAGGLLIALTSPRGALALDCASFLCSALLVRLATRARAPLGGQADPAARSNVLRDSLGGMSAVLADRRIRRVLLLGWLVPACSVAPEALAAPYVAHLGLSAGAVGWWLAAIPAGTIVGELVAIWFVPPAWRLRLIGVLAAATFVPLLAFAGQPGLALALPLLVASGLCSAWVLGQDALILEVTPEHLLGRVFSVNTAGLISLQGLGFAAAGALAEIVPPHVAIVVAAVAGLAVVASLAPGIRAPRASGDHGADSAAALL